MTIAYVTIVVMAIYVAVTSFGVLMVARNATPEAARIAIPALSVVGIPALAALIWFSFLVI